MGNLLMALAAIAVLMTGTLSFTTAWIAGADSSAEAFEAASDSRWQINRSSLRHIAGCVIPLGTTISATIENDGQSPLGGFGDWDVIAHYQSDGSVSVERLSYSEITPAAAGQWTLTDLRLVNGRSEAFGSGVLDPGERATITVELPASAIASGLNKLTVATREGAVAEISFDGTTTCGYYLHNAPSPPSGDTTSQADLPADVSFPGATSLYNYDTDRDAAAGLLLLKGGSGADEADLTKYQNWKTAALTRPLKLPGTVRVEFWAAVKDFNTTARGDVTVYLRDYDGASYTEIGNVTVTSDPWDALAGGTWVKATAAISGLDYTLPIGNRLEVKMIVPSASGDDMWLAYDTIIYPSSVTYADSLDLIFHTDQQRTGELLSFLARTGPHDDGYYLHSNPTPPIQDTTSQADLTATTSYPSADQLFNYDTDRDAQPGLVLLQGGSGASEADLTEYQNWRMAVLTEPLAISGPVSVNIWSAMKDFNTSLAGELKFFLRDYDGSSYTEITNGTLTANPWDVGATGTWVNRLLEIPSVDYTLAAGHQLELKVIVGSGSGDDMWLAYDTPVYDSVLRLAGQRDAEPGGRPLTAVAYAGASTGRFAPDLNGGRILYPLEGYSRITDAPWTITYRVRRDGYGFVWNTTAPDITPGTDNAWVNIDLSALVPLGTTGAVVEIVNTGGDDILRAVVRGVDDTREYVPDADAQKIRRNSHRWQVVKVDPFRKIQAFVEDTTVVKLKLSGYTVGTDPVYWSLPPDITPGTTGTWTTVDVASFVDDDTTGVILMLDSTGADVAYAVRETGSSFANTTIDLKGESNTMYFVGIDASDRFDIYLENSSINVYLVARTAGSVAYYVDDVVVADPLLKLWEPIDADTYSVPAVANGLILYAHNAEGKDKNFGIRENGSTDDWDKKLVKRSHGQGGVGLDADNIWEEYLEKETIDVSIAAYTMGPNLTDSDIHADLNVLVRKANGEVRTTLATNVGNTADITFTEWTTVTATFTPSEYTVVDQTDYLEFNVFAEVTWNEGSTASLEFRFDDNTISLDDQMGVRNLGLHRE